MEALARFKEFLNESNGSVIDAQWTAYVKSLVKDFDEEDILEDFENYVADKM